MKLETKRLILRRWEERDREPFRVINADPRTTEFYPCASTAEESDKIIQRAEAHFDKHGLGLFAVEEKETARLLGFVGLQWVPFEAPFTPMVEVGWRIAPETWNRGFATEAAQKALDFGFATMKLKEIVAMTSTINVKSRRVMEKLGMSYDPKDDFLHPLIADGHPLKPHVLYRLQKPC